MITHSRLLELMVYNPETGEFSWRVNRKGCAAGSKAGSLLTNGYLQIMIDGVKYSGQRLALFYVNGIWPKHTADHKSGNRSENSLQNLREATRKQNRYNTPPKPGCHSKWKGVTYDAGRKKCWKMAFKLPDGGKIQKRFEDEREAAEEYMFLALEHHGEFARFE